MDAAERAKRVTEIRLKAEEVLKTFQQEADDPEKGVGLEHLERYVAYERETTELFPSPSECPSCFARYGFGLQMLAEYFNTLRKAQEGEAEKIDPGTQDRALQEKRTKLLELAQANDGRATKHFREALTQYNFHLRAGGPVDPRVYWRGFECASRIERYKEAIQYLELYERNSRLPKEEKDRVKKWKDWAEDQYQRLLRRDAEKELEP
jgi:hypothetical protein